MLSLFCKIRVYSVLLCLSGLLLSHAEKSLTDFSQDVSCAKGKLQQDPWKG
jgi:hypothetical protein